MLQPTPLMNEHTMQRDRQSTAGRSIEKESTTGELVVILAFAEMPHTKARAQSVVHPEVSEGCSQIPSLCLRALV